MMRHGTTACEKRLRTRYFLPSAIAIALFAWASTASADEGDRALTLYFGHIAGANAWHDIVKHPSESDFTGSHLAVAAMSRVLSRHFDDRLSIDLEGQAGYNFGDQNHFEFNVAVGPRWRRFPWNDYIATTAAFGLGLSLATEKPETEIELEGDTERLLVYWLMELTLGPPRSDWALSLRLHHRSGAFGLLADDGGMNAVTLGARYSF